MNGWIFCGDAEPAHCHMVLISVYNARTNNRFVDTGALYSDGWYGSGWKLPDYCIAEAWQELPNPVYMESGIVHGGQADGKRKEFPEGFFNKRRKEAESEK